MPKIAIPLEQTQPARHDRCRTLLGRLGADGTGATVAVIDSGVDPDWLAGRHVTAKTPAVRAHDFTAGHEGWRETMRPPHGSRIVADILRDAPGAQIESLRVHGTARLATRADVVGALEWCGRNGMRVANLSFSAYNGCTRDAPCILCRSINTVALASDLFIVASVGDAFTAGEMFEAGKQPLACPVWNAPIAWGIGSPEIVATSTELFANKGGGLSFTTGKFSAGVAQLRGAFPRADLFATQRAIRHTCVPSPHVPWTLGFGRHCFVLAWLALSGSDAAGAMDLGALHQAAGAGPEGVDRGVLAALRTITAHAIVRGRWAAAEAYTADVMRATESWAGAPEHALLLHVRASCREATGNDSGAAEDYLAAEAALLAWLSPPGEAGAAAALPQ
jgi:hypothetical protein